MKLSFAAVLLAASSALAAVNFNTAPTSVTVGSTYPVTWSGAAAGAVVNVYLATGSSPNTLTANSAPLFSSSSATSFQWTVANPPSAPVYALKITSGSDVNWWGPVTISGVSSASVSGSAIMPLSTGATRSSMPYVYPTGYSTGTPNAYGNSTTLTASTVRVGATPTASIVQSTGGAASLGSPIALVLGAVVAMLYVR